MARLTPIGRASLRGRKRGKGKALSPRPFRQKPPEQFEPSVVNGMVLNREETRIWKELKKRPATENWEVQVQLGPAGKVGSRLPDFLSRPRRIVIEHQTRFHVSQEAVAKDALKKMMYKNMGFEVLYTYTVDLNNLSAAIYRLLG